jgi:GNAT superfamily N-acetyltransferase
VDLARLDPENLDRGDLDGAVAVLEAARVVDCPHELPRTVAAFTANIQHGWDGEPATCYVTRDDHGVVVGLLAVDLPQRDNRHLGGLEITVDPRARRQGLGRALYDAGVEKLRAEGRTLVMLECFDDDSSTGFMKSMGLDLAMAEVKRRQALDRLDWERLDREYAAAERLAAGYELVHLPPHIPDELMPDVVRLLAAINDAPTDSLDIEDEVFSPQRIRDFERSQAARERRIYRLAARHRETGVLAGHTIVGVEGECPWHAGQFDTSVLADHRGHRLGLLLKIAMLRLLRDAEPQVRELITWNAASNEHMIAVNEILGYGVVATAGAYQQHI